MNEVFKTGHLFLDILLYLILMNKLLIIFFQVFDNFLINRNILSTETIHNLQEILHYTFNYLMPILLIILFNPFTEKYLIIDHHIKLFLFVFGVLQIIDQTKALKGLSKSIH
jgi:hypothetical protein